MFRSEDMALCQMFIQPEAAYTTLSELGETGTVQFRDLNADVSSFHREFVSEIRRCEEMERKLRYIEKQIKDEDVTIPDLRNLMPRAPSTRDVIHLESELEKIESELMQLSHNANNLKTNYLELTEFLYVLEKSQKFFDVHGVASHWDSIINDYLQDDGITTSRERLGFFAGVVRREKVASFERIIWRISRGNVFLRFVEIEEELEDPKINMPVMKSVFIALFHGEQLRSRIQKVCLGYNATMYPCPRIYQEREEMIHSVKSRLQDLRLVLEETENHRQMVLLRYAGKYPYWCVLVRKMKAIYYTLNMFSMDVTKKCLIGEGWVPVNDLSVVQRALTEGSMAVGSTVPSFLNIIQTNEVPPTFNRTNKFTKGFQNLIDAYGIAKYREVNPALYTIITFPFIFGIMFGDVGHGFIMTLFGLWMIIYEKKLTEKNWRNEIWNLFFGGRYIILLMGLFSMYTGFIYNEIFSKSMAIFQTSWSINLNVSTVMGHPAFHLDQETTDFAGDAYPIGVDPAWQLATNKIVFTNTFKMKLSVIFGTVHMIFGICLNTINHINLKQKINIALDFFPQIIFLVFIFGYLSFLVIYKWIVYGPMGPQDIKYSTQCAPSVLILFIDMVLFKFTEKPAKNCEPYMFDGQKALQISLVVVAVCCVPWMLAGKPLYVYYKRKKTKSLRECVSRTTELILDTLDENITADPHEGNEEDFTELCIYQAIRTIEYVLGTVSHTASYLRLWALSLAHSQLSEVLWSRLLSLGLIIAQHAGFAGPIVVYIIFGLWACFTLAILILMEGLSAFLHTLRLHWVEFMSKFYSGCGHAFQPFSFLNILEADDTDIDKE